MSLKSLLTFSFVVLLLNGGPVNAVEAPVKVKVNTTHSHSVQDNKKPGESHKVQSNSRNKMKHQMNPAPKTHEEREVFHKQARPLTPMHPAPRTNGKHPQGMLLSLMFSLTKIRRCIQIQACPLPEITLKSRIGQWLRLAIRQI